MEEIEYIVEDAAKFIHAYISEKLSDKYSFDDIVDILEVQFDWQQEHLVNEFVDCLIDLPPIEINEEELKYYIINHCAAIGIILTSEELHEILDGEIEYMRTIGLISDTDEEKQRWAN